MTPVDSNMLVPLSRIVAGLSASTLLKRAMPLASSRVHAGENKCRQTSLADIQVNCLFCHTRRGLGLFQCFSHYLGIGRGKASIILKDFPSNFTVLWQYFRQFIIHFYTDKIRFYLDKQITFLNKLSEIIFGYNYRSG